MGPVALVLLVPAAIALASRGCTPSRPPPAARRAAEAPGPAPAQTPAAAPPRAQAPAPAAAPPDQRPTFADCAEGPVSAALANAGSLAGLAWTSGRLSANGWGPFAPLIGREIGSACPPASPGFARALASWQVLHRTGAGGVIDGATLDAFNRVWLSRRPFVAASARACPAPPPPQALAWTDRGETFAGQPIALRPGTLAAWRALTAAARRDLPAARADPRLFALISGFRAPASDAARCASQGNCGGVARATCSAHRTGLAMDLYLGAAPGEDPTAADQANRSFIAGGEAYRWMVAHADAFGFVPYPFEPWHWEWTGEPP